MFEMVIWMLATVGLANIMRYGEIFDKDHLGWRDKVRNRLGKYGDVFDCDQCMGWWAGLMTGAVYFSSGCCFPSLTGMGWLAATCAVTSVVFFNCLWILLSAFAGAAITPMYIMMVTFIESKTDFVIGDTDEPTEQGNE